jgi:hypothetical protein
MALLEPWAEGVWIAAAPHTMMGLHLGTRMTVVRLPSGGLWVHSPIAPTAALRAEIDALGAVEHVVAPNVFHHVFAGEMVRAYPQAKLHAARGLREKRADLRIDADLGPTADAAWGGALVPHAIEGCDLRETVYLHPGSRTLITSDLTENFTHCDHLPTRLYLKAAGVYQKVGWSRLLRFVYRDRAAARRSIDALLDLEFDHLIIAHGEPLRDGVKDAIRETFTFLGR